MGALVALVIMLLLALAVPAGAAPRHGHAAHRGHAARHHRAVHHRAKHRSHRTKRRRVVAKRASVAPRLFAPTSVWNQPVAAGAPLDPQSPALVAALAAEAKREADKMTGPGIATTSYSTPIYVAGPTQPSVSVALDDPTAAWRVTLQGALQAVPIPANAQAAAGTDAQLTVYQPSTDRLWELFKARKLADGWHAAWGGAIDHVSQSPGYYTTGSWAGAGSWWGASATSLPLAAGTMTLADLRSGTIDHALAMEVPFARKGVYSWPAQRSDGLGADLTNLPEGAHLRLDPKLDVRALHLPPLTQAMALAAQRYGMIVRDQTGQGVGFYGEDPTPTGADPYHGKTGFFGGLWPFQLFAHFPWSSLQVLRMDLHSTATH
jgi:hypothetical protein